jgi:non-specific serine/threonine protein kinase
MLEIIGIIAGIVAAASILLFGSRGLLDLLRGASERRRRSREVAAVDRNPTANLFHAALPRNFPPLRIVGPVAGNLPVELSSFVGRDDEIRTVGKRLSAARLVTLVGIGGAGKTRLALKSADEQREAYPDGVWLVQLASLTDPSLVDREVTATIGPLDRDRRLLLVIDSCEHLLETCARTAVRVLQEAPLGRILATSREPLGVPGEVIFRVPPMSIPPSTDLSPESLSTYEAVALFLDRARSAQPGFALTQATGPAVSQIARRLDGIPLAIELAAARVNVLSAEEIARRLDDMFHLLGGGSRTALPQQRTLEAAIDWSYRLLPRPEQLLFNRLSVFRGGFTLEAAEQVGAGSDQGPDVLELLSQLVNKSVVTVEQKEGRPTRYRLLETLRQYGRDRLRESDETTDRRDRHTRFFMELAQNIESKLQSTISAGLLASLKDDHDNLRAAVEWGLDSNNPEFVGSESMGSLVSIVMAL